MPNRGSEACLFIAETIIDSNLALNLNAPLNFNYLRYHSIKVFDTFELFTQTNGVLLGVRTSKRFFCSVRAIFNQFLFNSTLMAK